MADKIYKLGRGKIFFDKFAPGTKIRTGELYLGNTPEFNLSAESETLDHFYSDEGVRVKDDSVVLQTNRTATVVTDNISKDNIALWFNGTKSTVTQTATPVADELVSSGSIIKEAYYQLGTSLNKAGIRGCTAVTISAGASAGAATPLVLNTDYTLDAALGRIQILPGATVTATHNLYADFTPTANTREQITVTSGATVDGALRFVAVNPKGENVDYYMPYVTLSPNGDFALKGDDWQQLPFNIEILQLDDNTASIYADGRPV